MPDTGFSGFPDGTFRFLRELADNNRKDWFDAHRDDYEAFYIAPARAFIAAVGPRLKKVSPAVQFEPKVNGSIFRINRDVRFSKDKTPYRATLDLWFWHGARGGWAAPGFFFRLGPDKVGVGVGMHMFQKPQLDAYRNAVIDPRAGKALVKAIGQVKAAGDYTVHGASRKAVPRGFDVGHARAGLLLHEGLWADWEHKTDRSVRGPAFAETCVARFADMWPVGKWLLAELAE